MKTIIVKEDKSFEVQLVSAVIGTCVGLFLRKKMHEKGMIKSFWLPCVIKKPGTFR